MTSPVLQKTAQDIRQRIFDYFFFTEPRNVFTLANEGYYPQGMTQLGGPAEPTDHPVMQVRTPRRVLLRGAVMNEYTAAFGETPRAGDAISTYPPGGAICGKRSLTWIFPKVRPSPAPP